MQCSFAHSGFNTGGLALRPCGTAYHTGCIVVAAPFASRRRNQAGLTFPKVRHWGPFICEACTVRSVLGRELTGATDGHLLALERMRILDMAHSWSAGTHSTYQSKLGIIRHFEASFDLQILRPTTLLRPPGGADIPLMWCQEAYSLRRSTKRREAQGDLTLAFSTIRQLRSAASQFMAWDAMIAHPQAAYLDQQRRLVYQTCRPTDGLSYTLHTQGMSSRLGDEARPSVALLDRQVRFLDQDLDRRFRQATCPMARRDLALAGLANLSLWLGWLRSAETFGINWVDVETVEPRHGPLVDLPRGCGLVSYRMLPETKSNRTSRPDVIMAYRTLSGYCLGTWLRRARLCSGLGTDWHTCHRPLFSHQDGTRWDSSYFRATYVYPSLRQQQAAGDSYLRAFDGSPGNSIEEKFWSLHCYRRGARSHVSRGGLYGKHRFRRAREPQVYEHARWRRKRSGERIDVIYREWTLHDRVQITLCCH